MAATKINLLNDYNSVAHPSVLEALRAHLGERYEGYGLDRDSEEARAMILGMVKNPQAAVHFLIGGTHTNLVTLSASLRPHEAVIAPLSAHISQHETGAIEATGHKVLTVESNDGKVKPEAVRAIIDRHTDEHMVKPRLLFISQTTEYGTVYTRAELTALRELCATSGLLLYVDGARLGYALASDRCDLSLPDIAELADAFYIGGTKGGLLFGEALVLCNPDLQDDFRFLIKQRGGLLAKGFLLGIQFKALFEDGLYFELARQANRLAARFYTELRALGYSFEIETESNQIFPIVDNRDLPRLTQHVEFNLWNRLGADRTSIRFVTTWETTEDDIQAVLELMSK